ncbi:uncharacterized protein FOMMEDRAFT_139688 [Fomitiporia mediterranea MF3/22]|uniref:uncharacterized protein n=1 Tax=Fomitiporia mediterranea (strain MF3/22) TaxID=694068 RepID=UPI00044075EF|nr:uncharacterized protein FOMMEDRAFT_139688 [Fomitiporia mediterranea MF3/22]EJD05156.1 hypothetical protein FOMMEDRAFT_139688 [Fomitiporia mediterranea MF3/22]
MSQQQLDAAATVAPPPMSAPSTSTFTFATPYPPAATATVGSQATLKQRRVSLALPNSPRLVPAWSFRDDTTIDAHVASSSQIPQDKKGKMRKASADEQKVADKASVQVPEKRQRKKWTEEETQMLVNGCNVWGVGNWKAILNDPNLKFDSRSPVDLKDRFRTFFPDAYKLHYPNAKTHLSSKVRSTLPDGSSLFEKTRSKKRRPFTPEEDQALKAGYERYGTVWSTIVKDPIFQEQKRRSTDLRDRFRNAFPHLYQAAGYKPRSMPKKKRGDASISAPRATADDQLLPTRMAGTARRRRSRTTTGHSYSVPQSAAVSEDEDTSDEEEEDAEVKRRPNGLPSELVKEMTPQPETTHFSPPESMLNEVTMHTIDQLDDLAFPDFLPDSSQALSDSTTEHSIWSSGPRSPQQIDSWSSAATTTTASPTSSHLSMNDYFMDSTATIGRREGMNMIGKSAWGTSDWLSANPRMDPSTSSNSSFADGPSPPPSSPFSFSNLSHGIMDRYDLFQNSIAHDFASEVGASDAYSTFSDPELFPSQSMRGFTHHSNYAGDLIFGARTHQPAAPANTFSGLGLSGMHEQTAGINPMQLHTPSLPGIDELAAINLNDDDEPMIASTTTTETSVKKDDTESSLAFDADLSSLIHLPPQTLEEIAGLSGDVSQMEQESAVTPPATPALTSRVTREQQGTSYSAHNRSMSVPPFERVVSRQPPPPGHATPHPAPTRSLSQFDIPPFSHDADLASTLQPNTMQTNSPTSTLSASSFFSASLINDSFKSLDLSDLVFLDLHAPTSDFTTHDLIDSHTDEARNGQALDLAQSPSHSMSSMSNSILHSGTGVSGGMDTSSLSLSPLPMFDTIGRAAGSALHQRVQSQTNLAVAPKDLFLPTYDSKQKRASWDGTQV